MKSDRIAFAAGIAIVVPFAVVALFARWLAPSDPNLIVPDKKFRPPFWSAGGTIEHMLGTDQLGRDLLSRIMYGAQTSLYIAVGAVLISTTIGVLVGLVSGYTGGWADKILMGLTEVQLAFPFILLALAILSIADTKSPPVLIGVLSIASWVIYARVVRAQVLIEREKEYILSATVNGATRLRIMFRYILPNVLPLLVVIVLLQLATMIIIESVLAFVALGVDPPAISWGLILAEGRRNIATAWWMLAFPGFAIFLLVLGINLIADARPSQRRPTVPVRLLDTDDRATPHAASGASDSNSDHLLEVTDLRVRFATGDDVLNAVDGVSFHIDRGELVALVGESGSGKSLTALSIIGLQPPAASLSGSIQLDGHELVRASGATWRSIRGRRISMIFQNPGTSLNPLLKIRTQLIETLGAGQSKESVGTRCADALRDVNITDVDRVMNSYPFELSGGMQQRVMIAIALLGEPELLIADEPTTALDVTTQAQILDELAELARRRDLSVLMITHDLGIVRRFAERTVVMYSGRECETAPTRQLLDEPQHPYSRALVETVMALEQTPPRLVGIDGRPPEPIDRPQGCAFAPRCDRAQDDCTTIVPTPQTTATGRAACLHIHDEVVAG